MMLGSWHSLSIGKGNCAIGRCACFEDDWYSACVLLRDPCVALVVRKHCITVMLWGELWV